MSLLKGVGIFNSARSRRESTRLVGIQLSVGNTARRVTKKATTFPTGQPEALQSTVSEHDHHWDDGGEFVGGDIEEPRRSSTHQKKKKKAAEQWKTSRGNLLAAFREQLVPPQSPVVPNVQERQLFDVPIVVLMCTSVKGVLGRATKNIFHIICWKHGR